MVYNRLLFFFSMEKSIDYNDLIQVDFFFFKGRLRDCVQEKRKGTEPQQPGRGERRTLGQPALTPMTPLVLVGWLVLE